MRALSVLTIVALAVPMAALGVPAAVAGPVCVNHLQEAPEGCRVELKGYGGWGACAHFRADTCAYVQTDGDACVYRNDDVACEGLFPNGRVCANNEQWAPEECRLELKGYGGWGACNHAQWRACVYLHGDLDPCVYSYDRDVVCAPLP